jgi:hypothetical protein
MRFLCLIVVLLYSCLSNAQQNCIIGYTPNSNDINYNQPAVDSILGLKNYDVFLFGESHTTNFEPEFKFNFVKHLNGKYGVRQVFMEIGTTAAYCFNNYLTTGDTAIFTKYKLPYLWGKYKNFWIKLFEYNRKLPDSLKLNINGVDFERIELFAFLVNNKKPNIAIPNNLKPTFLIIESILQNKPELFSKTFKNAINQLKKDFTTYEQDFRVLYNEEFDIVKKAILNETPRVAKPAPRNKAWLLTIQQKLKEMNSSKFVGFFGAAHTTYKNEESIANMLQTSANNKSKILTISAIYKNFLGLDGPNKVFEYGRNEQTIYDRFHEPSCRATIVSSSVLPKINLKMYADFIIFAQEIIPNLKD